jgi:hypothetical protein
MGIRSNTANDNWGSIVVKIKAGVKAENLCHRYLMLYKKFKIGGIIQDESGQVKLERKYSPIN